MSKKIHQRDTSVSLCVPHRTFPNTQPMYQTVPFPAFVSNASLLTKCHHPTMERHMAMEAAFTQSIRLMEGFAQTASQFTESTTSASSATDQVIEQGWGREVLEREEGGWGGLFGTAHIKELLPCPCLWLCGPCGRGLGAGQQCLIITPKGTQRTRQTTGHTHTTHRHTTHTQHTHGTHTHTRDTHTQNRATQTVQEPDTIRGTALAVSAVCLLSELSRLAAREDGFAVPMPSRAVGPIVGAEQPVVQDCIKESYHIPKRSLSASSVHLVSRRWEHPTCAPPSDSPQC